MTNSCPICFVESVEQATKVVFNEILTARSLHAKYSDIRILFYGLMHDEKPLEKTVEIGKALATGKAEPQENYWFVQKVILEFEFLYIECENSTAKYYYCLHVADFASRLDLYVFFIWEMDVCCSQAEIDRIMACN